MGDAKDAKDAKFAKDAKRANAVRQNLFLSF